MGGVKKEYQKLNDGESALGYSVRSFAAAEFIDTIVIAVPKNGEEEARKALPLRYLEAQKPKIVFVTGGSTRRASVFNSLVFLASLNPCYVLIHDGARPWISAELINNLIEAVQKHDAVIPVLPVTDTPKELGIKNEDGVFIERHLRRSNVVSAQTPQAFKFHEILKAHEKAAQVNDEEFTDDAEIWGRFAGKVACISGEAANKKITFIEDLQ